MKTEIKLNDLDFGNSRLLVQISDDPQTSFARFIVFWDVEIKTRAEYIKIDADMVYVDPVKNKILPNFTHEVLNNGSKWIIDNSTISTKLDSSFSKVVNPDFDNTKDEGIGNEKFIKQGSFDMYCDLIFNIDKPIPLTQLVKMGIYSDDDKGYFN